MKSNRFWYDFCPLCVCVLLAFLFYLTQPSLQAELTSQEVSWQITVWDHGSIGHKNTIFYLSDFPKLEGDVWHCQKLNDGELFAPVSQSTLESTPVGTVNSKRK